jgi:hypothetical protein
MTTITTTTALRTAAELDAIVERGKRAFIEVGAALAEIRDRKLYLELGYASFGDYCQQRHGFSASRGRQLIAAAATVTTVTLAGGTPPVTEREARALAAAQRAHDAVMNEPAADASLVSLGKSGGALGEIRDRKLYLEGGYADFDAYCRDRWGFSAADADHVIAVADLVPAMREWLHGGPSADIVVDAARVRRGFDAVAKLADASGDVSLLAAIAHLCERVGNLAAEHGLRCQRQLGELLAAGGDPEQLVRVTL